MANENGTGNSSKVRMWVSIVGMVISLVGAIWLASLRPLTRDVAKSEAKVEVLALEKRNDIEHQRLESIHVRDLKEIKEQHARELAEIKETLKSIDRRLYELATRER